MSTIFFIYLNKLIKFLYVSHILNLLKSLIVFEFVLSILILLILILILLKRNFINFYSLLLLNIVVFICFTTIFFQELFIYNFLNFVEQINNSDFSLYRSDLIQVYNFCYSSIITLSHTDLKTIYFGDQVVSYYKSNFVFTFFNYYVKLFTIFVFFMSLIIAYLNRKTLKISYDKIILLLFPILFSSLIIIQTQDLFIAFLAIELQNLCLIFLMSLKKRNAFNIQLSVRFFILNSIGSLFILFGIVILYLNFYTTNFSDIYLLCSTVPTSFLNLYFKNQILFSLGMILIGLMFKLGVGPFGLWLVDIYEYGLSYGVLIFSILPKISYFMFLFHLYLATSTFVFFWDFTLKFFGILSILIGTFGALQQNYFKRLLAFSSLNYFGYILLTFVGFNSKSFTFCIIYLYVYIFISFYIWFVILYLERVLKRNVILTDLVIFRDHYPILNYILVLSLFFLSGLPPFYLFILKFYTFTILLQNFSSFLLIVVFLFCNFISIFYYLNLIKIILFNPLPSVNYPSPQISTFAIFLIFIFGFYILSPLLFLVIKNLYILFSKLLKNYMYNFFTKNTYNTILNKITYIKTLVKFPTQNLLNPRGVYMYNNYTKLYLFDINSINVKTFKVLIRIKKASKKIDIKYFTINRYKLLRLTYISKKVKLISNFILDLKVNNNINVNLYKKFFDLAFYRSIKDIALKPYKITYKFLTSKQIFSHVLLRAIPKHFSNINLVDTFKSKPFNNLNIFYNVLNYYMTKKGLAKTLIKFSKRDIKFNRFFKNLSKLTLRLNILKFQKFSRHLIIALPKIYYKLKLLDRMHKKSYLKNNFRSLSTFKNKCWEYLNNKK
jgi:proton-translocating NADH-quinone oxidoreductase chain N